MAEINYYADHIIQGTLSTTGTVSLGGTLTVQSGSINLGSGLGRIQGVDTVSASTDAANKAYVDAHPAGNVTGSGSSGRVAFWNGSTNIASNANLYWDNTNNRLGIGTTSPSTALSVSGAISAITSDYVQGTTGSRLLMHSANTGNSHSYIQAQSSGGTSSAEDLALQLYGGNVGIGTSSPDSKLNIEGTKNTAILTLGNTTSGSSWVVGDRVGGIDFYSADGSGGGIGVKASISYEDASGGTGSSQAMVFRTGGTSAGTNNVERMRLQYNGNVGIGTSSPIEKLQVNGNAAIYGDIKGYIGSSSNQYLSILQSSSFTYLSTGTTNETIYFGIGPVANVTNISVAGTATATNFILSSDKTLKDKIKNIKASHVDIKWKNFELISEPGVKRSGVIAQELEEKHPEFIRTDKDGLKSVAYIDLLITKIAELEARLEKAGL